MKKKVFLFCTATVFTLTGLLVLADEPISSIDEQVVHQTCASFTPCENYGGGEVGLPLNVRISSSYGDRCCWETSLHRGCKKSSGGGPE